VTRAELDAAGARVAGRLRRAGLAAGGRVLVSAATSMDLVAAYLGALRMGLVVVPVNTAAGSGRWPKSWPTPGPRRPWSSTPNGAAGPDGRAAATCWSPEDRLVLPLFHIHGLGVGLHGTLLAGASAVLLPRFDVDAVLDAARDHRATLFFGVPTMYARLAGSPRAGELGRLRLCVSGSAPLQGADHHRRLQRPSPRGRGAAGRAPGGGRGGGRRDPLGGVGEQVTAFVVPAGPAAPPDPGELLAFTTGRLAGFKRPRAVHHVESLPRNALGKVLRHELRG
jgi:acyl-CoA synthetase (AMP-forming)/AMP-acid ligase II